MYHPARVVERIDTGQKTVFLVETWDENTFTLDAADDLDADSVGTDAVVLLDYYPDERFDIPTPRQVVATVVPDDQADDLWDRYRKLYEESPAEQTAPMQMPNQPFEGGYIG